MRLETTLLSAAAVASLASALVIPGVNRHEKDVAPCNKEEVASVGRPEHPARGGRKAPKGKEKNISKSRGSSDSSKTLAPLSAPSNPLNIIPHRYIIVFKQNVSPEEVKFHKERVSQEHAQALGKIDRTHSFFLSTTGGHSEYGVMAKSVEGGIQDSFGIGDMLSGYIGYFTDEVVEFIRMNPLVEFVEKDSMVFSSEFNTQNGAPWGLSRISHREKLNLGSFNKYLYDDDAGKGVTSYIIDTGINVDHKDFEGRAVWGKTIPTNDADIDGNGHGTHCAGTIASKHYGVAKNADVVAVKVLRSNGSGTMSDVVKGVEFAAQSHQKAVKDQKKGFKGSTANMSLGGGKSPALDLAVNAAVKAGIHFAVAAGNENQDACNTSPAAAENAVTVGASTLSDDRAYFSNWGKCVDIFAPGLNILSTYIGTDTATATLSGTSMASPHVAGLLTYFLSLQPGADSEYFRATGGVTPAQLKKKLIEYSTKDVLADLPEDTPNSLIYNGGGQDLDGLWGKDFKPEGQSQSDSHSFMPQDLSLEKLINSLDSKTDALFDDVRHLLDQFNII